MQAHYLQTHTHGYSFVRTVWALCFSHRLDSKVIPFGKWHLLEMRILSKRQINKLKEEPCVCLRVYVHIWVYVCEKSLCAIFKTSYTCFTHLIFSKMLKVTCAPFARCWTGLDLARRLASSFYHICLSLLVDLCTALALNWTSSF